MKVPHRLTLLGALFTSIVFVDALFSVPEIVIPVLDRAGAVRGDAERQEQCCSTAYIRAPDLRPGMTSTVDARLMLNGTGCDRVEKWEVGLRLVEWAIFRFSAPNVTLPVKPEWSQEFDSLPSSETSNEDEIVSGLFANMNSYSYMRSPETPYQIAMADFDKAMNNISLWRFQAAEREVFDSTVELDLQQQEQTIKNDTTYIATRQFVVDVPDTNFPPRRSFESHYYGSSGYGDDSNVDTMFEYYFRLTLRNGTVLDLPAGRTAFIPSNTEGPMAEIEVQTMRMPEAERTISVKMDEINTMTGQTYGKKGRSARWIIGEDPGEVRSNFTVELLAPPKPTVEAGRNITIQARIRKTGDTTDVPHAISLAVSSCTIDSWAKSHATTPNQTETTDACAYPNDDNWWRMGRHDSGGQQGDMLVSSRDMRDLCIHPMEWSQEEEEQRRMRKSGRLITSMSISYPWMADDEGMTPVGVDKIDDTISVNLSIPANMIPTFDTTFRQYRHTLDVVLITTSSEEGVGEDDEGIEALVADADDLESELNWLPRPTVDYNRRPPPRRRDGKKQVLTRHQGSTPVRLLASTSSADAAAVNAGAQTRRIRHYGDAKAFAIRLRGNEGQDVTDYPLVNTVWRTDFKPSELAFDRYNIERRRDGECDNRRMAGTIGSSFDLVSDIWARKACPEYRKNWFAARKVKKGKQEVEREASGGESAPADPLMGMGTNQIRLD